MLALLIENLTDMRVLLALAGGLAVAVTIMTVAAPLLEGNALGKHMKSVATERDKIRAREYVAARADHRRIARPDLDAVTGVDDGRAQRRQGQPPVTDPLVRDLVVVASRDEERDDPSPSRHLPHKRTRGIFDC